MLWKAACLEVFPNNLIVKKQQGSPTKTTSTKKMLDPIKKHHNAVKLLKQHFKADNNKILCSVFGFKLLRKYENKLTVSRIKSTYAVNSKIIGVVTDSPDHVDKSNESWKDKSEWKEFCENLM